MLKNSEDLSFGDKIDKIIKKIKLLIKKKEELEELLLSVEETEAMDLNKLNTKKVKEYKKNIMVYKNIFK